MAVTFNLSDRLKTVEGAVGKWNTVADIGCDHGYVSISLINDKKAQKVLACDVNEGPLKAAKENIIQAGLEGIIETRLSDGLHKLTIDDGIEALVIAGMGGRLMARILEEGIEIVKECKQLVLQPQSEGFLVRQWLFGHGFAIDREFMVEDMGKFYWIIDASHGEYIKPVNPETEKIFNDFSGYLLQNRDMILKKYLDNQLLLSKQYLNGIEVGKGESLRLTIKEIETALEYYH